MVYEIVFHDSLGGSMKEARCMREAHSGDKVIVLSLDLDQGSIKNGILNPEKRQRFIEKIDGSRYCDPDPHEQQASTWAYLLTELERMQQLAADGATFRIWYSDRPDELCGLYFVCHELLNKGCDIYTVKLPEAVVKGKDMILYRIWDEIVSEELMDFAGQEHLLEAAEVRGFAWKWEELMEQDGPLRINLNGKICTVGDEFYDYILMQAVPEGIFRGVDWIFRAWDMANGAHEEVLISRVNALIAAGKIEVVEKGKESIYESLLRQAQ